MLNTEWIDLACRPMSAENLALLFEAKIPAIAIPGFISKADCDRMIHNLAGLGMCSYDKKPVSRLGPSQIESHLKNDKAGYFAEAEGAFKNYYMAIEGIEDPVQKVMRLMTKYSGR